MKKIVSFAYVVNIVSQAFFNLAFPIGAGVLGSYLLVRFAEVGAWIYALLVTLGALIGFYSMIKFVLSAMAALERLEREQEEKYSSEKKNEEK